MGKPIAVWTVGAAIALAIAAHPLLAPAALATGASARDAVVILAVGDGGGQPGGVVSIPVRLIPVDGGKLDANAIAGIDLEIEWDTSLASLEDVATTSETAGWQVAFNATAGRVRISMAGLTPVGPAPFGVEVVQLAFRLAEVSGSTALHAASTRVFDRQREPVPHLAVDGRLSVSVVNAERCSMGELKARFP